MPSSGNFGWSRELSVSLVENELKMGEGGKKRKGLFNQPLQLKPAKMLDEENYQSWVCAKNASIELINLRLVDNEDETYKNIGREDEVVCIHQS